MPRRKNFRNLTIKHAIESNGFTQQDIADALNVTLPHVNQVVMGKRRSPRIEKYISQITGVDFNSVFQYTGA